MKCPIKGQERSTRLQSAEKFVSELNLLTTGHEDEDLLSGMRLEERPEHIQLFMKFANDIRLSESVWSCGRALFMNRYEHGIFQN